MKLRFLSALVLTVSLLLALACQPATTGDLKSALDAITANDIMQHTKVLSADEYEGRGPGTKGEELTVKYLTEQFQKHWPQAGQS